ncbi:hypothetical protein E2C01_063565 [Portunus trituberculatus]|uniref:Uncharacterized protein n=1 Tax=Portunus trituberculatus TaxID=210409 RepID=A0A5B7HE09_PORTR|nr:hypothetical protein [Portunus trituberculatus]
MKVTGPGEEEEVVVMVVVGWVKEVVDLLFLPFPFLLSSFFLLLLFLLPRHTEEVSLDVPTTSSLPPTTITTTALLPALFSPRLSPPSYAAFFREAKNL